MVIPKYSKCPKGFMGGRLIAPDLLLLPNGERQKLSGLPRHFEIGDIIAVNPELTDAVLLAPALEIPDLISADHLALQWSRFLQTVRHFFRSEMFQEVFTPTLVQSSGAETHLDPFVTKYKNRTFYLPTSPEFHLKKLLASGLNKIFEIKNCFRNDEISKTHQPEFTMLEWYRGYSGLDEIIADVKGLLKSVAKEESTEITSMRELFKIYLNFELTPLTTKEQLKTLVPHALVSDSWSDVFFRIFLEKIEPLIGRDKPLIVTDFPPSLAALARINEHGWAERFELYWRGLELGNAYDELNDPSECEKRLNQWNEEKQKLRHSPIPHSNELLSALRSGMPPSGGIAMGLERLFMAMYRVDDIAQARFFPARAGRR